MATSETNSNLELADSSCAGITVKAEEDINTVNEVGQHLLKQSNAQLQQVHDPHDSHVMYPWRSWTIRPHSVVALQMPYHAVTSQKSSFFSHKTSSKPPEHHARKVTKTTDP